MIRSITENPDGTPYVLLGLTAKSLEKLVRYEQPIVVNLSRLVRDQQVPLPDVSVAIFFASDAAVATMMEQYGAHDATSQTSYETNEGEQRHGNSHDPDGTGDGLTRAERERNRKAARRRRGRRG